MKTVVNIKVDKQVKLRAQKLAKELGLSLSTVLNAYLRQFVRDEQVTFAAVPRMSAELEKLLGPIETDIKKGRNLSTAFTNKKELDDVFASL